jgi:4,5-DOPA dioxygenase extradiol
VTVHPALFIGHGSPMQAIEPSRFTAAWQLLGRELPRPRAILAVSAHWYGRGTAVTAQARPRTIHDFYGFPPALYALQYPAPGAPQLAARLATLLAPTAVRLDAEWGLDHGSWSVLRYLYPQADIPVIQLSLDASLSGPQHYALAQRLAPLRDEGVLVLGSGNVVHNLRLLQFDPAASAPPWALSFNAAVRAGRV